MLNQLQLLVNSKLMERVVGEFGGLADAVGAVGPVVFHRVGLVPEQVLGVRGWQWWWGCGGVPAGGEGAAVGIRIGSGWKASAAQVPVVASVARRHRV